MDTPPKKNTQKSETPTSKSRLKGVSLSHLGRRSRSLDFEIPDSKQTLSKNNTSVCESSWRCVVPSTSLHLNAFAMSSKKKRVKLNPDEGESCKRCNCKKCLKLYNDTHDDDSSKTPAPKSLNCACYCKKSNCTQGRCGCYQGGVRCSINCLCEGCLNKFGAKMVSFS